MEIMVMGKKKIAILWDCHESASGGGGGGGWSHLADTLTASSQNIKRETHAHLLCPVRSHAFRPGLCSGDAARAVRSVQVFTHPGCQSPSDRVSYRVT